MTTSTTLDPAAVGQRAAEILSAMQAHRLWDRFTTSSMKYSPCWATYTGMPSISRFDLDRDGQPLLVEAMRALALKAAVFELSGGDEKTAELLLPLPVDDMVHAVLAQHTVMSWIERDLGVLFPHDTDLEDFSYCRGCDTDVYYAAAGWGQQPPHPDARAHPGRPRPRDAHAAQVNPMDLTNLDAIIDSRCEQAGLPARLARTPIRVWQKSGVERLHLADQTTVVVKYAGAPFTGEARILRALAVHGVPVPTVLAAHQTDALLVMLLQDLGERVREPTDRDGAHAAAHLHRAGVGRDGLDVWDAARLSQLPETIIQQLTLHHDAERLPATRCLLPPLQLLARHARRLVDGADIEPFGVVHGELHPTSVHIGDRGWHLVDLAMAFVGPGLLDLATWHGTRQPPDITRLQTHLHAYVAAGGHKTVLRSRGGLAATRWSLGWHRLWSVGWLLRQATTAPDDHRDPNVTDVLTRQIQAARCLLTSGP